VYVKRCTITVGNLWGVSAVEREVRGVLFREGFEFTIEKQRGWMNTVFYLTVRGPIPEKVENVVSRISAWINQ
jgi:hypothetical protein